MTVKKRSRVLVLGGGFGGLTFCQAFQHPEADVTLVDAQNHHLFQPLLYQVAAAGLSSPDIAEPVRSILSARKNVTVLMDLVHDIDIKCRQVRCQSRVLDFDYLVVALGGVTSYFGHPEWSEHAPGLKSLEDALRIRQTLLLSFERAENEQDPSLRERLMTIVVVGGGPTGVELAGAFAELARHVLMRDFRHINPALARIVLVEAGPKLLPQMPDSLSASALRQLESFGVEIRLNTKVADIRKGEVQLEGGSVLAAETIVWSAGVTANPLSARLGAELDRSGRVKVEPDLSLAGHPEVFVVGDMAAFTDSNGKPVPGVSPAAMQMARHVALVIKRDLDGKHHEPIVRPQFRYRDKGMMATIGRSAAVAKIGRLEMDGFLAWLAWLFVHLIFLVGFDNKLSVLLQWAYAYCTYKRGARIILRNP